MTKGMELFVFSSVAILDTAFIVALICLWLDGIKEKREDRIKELAKQMMEEEKKNENTSI
jgi:hypothetical protein